MEFLKVLPVDIARVGADGACILALIRYETAVDNEYDGRHICEGAMWWQASYVRIGEALGGAHPESVRRTISKLVKLGELLRCVLIPSHDRTKAYRCSDQSFREIDGPLTSHSAKSTDHPSKSTDHPSKSTIASVEIDDCTITPEITEEENKEREKRAPKRGTRLPPNWLPPTDVVEQMSKQHPNVDQHHELAKFLDYWHSTTRNPTKLDWSATYRNWIRRAAEQPSRASPNGHALATSDRRFLEVQAMKNQPPKLLSLLNKPKEIPNGP